MYKKKDVMNILAITNLQVKWLLKWIIRFVTTQDEIYTCQKKTVEYQEKCTSLACYAENGGNSFLTFRN